MMMKMRKAVLVLLSCALLVCFLFWGKGRSRAEGFRASGGFAKCAFSNYDNLDSGDDPNAGHFEEMRNVSEKFLKSVGVCAIHEKDWNRYKYHFLEVIVRNKKFRVLAMDKCSDADQDSSCTTNMKAVGASFLVDLEKRTKDYHLPNQEDLQDAGYVRDLGKCNMGWLNRLMSTHGLKWDL